MREAFERVCGPTGGALATTGAALLLGLVLVAGERSLAPLMMGQPDDRTLTGVLATDAVYWHVASYAMRLERPQGFFTTAELTENERLVGTGFLVEDWK